MAMTTETGGFDDIYLAWADRPVDCGYKIKADFYNGYNYIICGKNFPRVAIRLKPSEDKESLAFLREAFPQKTEIRGALQRGFPFIPYGTRNPHDKTYWAGWIYTERYSMEEALTDCKDFIDVIGDKYLLEE